MSFVNSKLSALARLMAGENITISHSERAVTASMNLETRILELPMFKNCSDELYEMLMAHEVSHALHTPAQGWHSNVHKMGMHFKGYLNVVEDIRIERLIKAKYPGLRRSFVKGYQELLFTHDFFGMKKKGRKNPNTWAFVDKLNLHAKVGNLYPLNFTKEEQLLVDEAFELATFEDAEAFAIRLFNNDNLKASKIARIKKSKQTSLEELEAEIRAAEERKRELREKLKKETADVNAEKLQESAVPDEEMLEEEFFEKARKGDEDAVIDVTRDELDIEGILREEAQRGLGKEESKQNNNETVFNEEIEHTGPGQIDLTDYRELDRRMEELNKLREKVARELEDDEAIEKQAEAMEVVAETDEEYRENEETLVKSAKNSYYGYETQRILNLHDAELSKFIVPSKTVIALGEEHAKKVVANSHWLRSRLETDSLKKFLNNISPSIHHMISEFEMRKNANQLARAGVAKTGELNMKRLHASKLVDDVFKRVQKLPEGKSHGMLMFLDQSGSMESCYAKSIEQVITMAEFCRRVSIPFAVYGFTDLHTACEARQSPYFVDKPLPGKVQLRSRGVLKHYIDSTMPANEYKRALNHLWNIRLNDLREGSIEDLNGTPMNQAILLSGMLAKQFKASTKVDVVNVVFVTDGDACDSVSENAGQFSNSYGRIRVNYNGHLSSVCSTSGSATTAAMADLMKRATGANYISIYIPSNMHDAKRRWSVFSDHIESKLEFTFDRNGFQMTKNFGFDAYFVMKPLVSNDAATLNVDDKMTPRQISKELTRVLGKKNHNRAFLNAFLSQIVETV